MRSVLVCIDVCSDLVFGEVCSILLPTMRSEIFQSLSLLIVVEDGRDSDCLTQLSNRSLTSMQYKHYCRASFFVTVIVASNWGSVSTLLLKRNFLPCYRGRAGVCKAGSQ